MFDNGNPEANPSELATAEFWVTNVGAAEDTVEVDISDGFGWLVARNAQSEERKKQAGL